MRSLLMVLMLVAAAAGAQDKYPARPITIINPYAAGSSMEIMARAVGDQFTRAWGQGVVVTSRDGASGVVGMTVLMQAAPDGYTLAFTPMVPVVVQPHLNRDSRVNPDTVQPVIRASFRGSLGSRPSERHMVNSSSKYAPCCSVVRCRVSPR